LRIRTKAKALYGNEHNIRTLLQAMAVKKDKLDTRPGMPIGYWLGIEIPFENDKWGIDLWLQTHEWANKFDEEFDDYKTKLSTISKEQIAAILSIKYHLIRLGKYGKPNFMSFNVYDTVLDKGAVSIEDFLDLTSAS